MATQREWEGEHKVDKERERKKGERWEMEEEFSQLVHELLLCDELNYTPNVSLWLKLKNVVTDTQETTGVVTSSLLPHV